MRGELARKSVGDGCLGCVRLGRAWQERHEEQLVLSYGRCTAMLLLLLLFPPRSPFSLSHPLCLSVCLSLALALCENTILSLTFCVVGHTSALYALRCGVAQLCGSLLPRRTSKVPKLGEQQQQRLAQLWPVSRLTARVQRRQAIFLLFCAVRFAPPPRVSGPMTLSAPLRWRRARWATYWPSPRVNQNPQNILFVPHHCRIREDRETGRETLQFFIRSTCNVTISPRTTPTTPIATLLALDAESPLDSALAAIDP